MTFPYPYVGPISLYNNLPIRADFYIPNFFFIEDITKGALTTVTTTIDHNYVIGQLVRFLVPQANGMRQINGQQGYVLEIPSANEAVINIDSRNFDSFVTTNNPNQPQILAIGDISSGNINSHGNLQTSTIVPGSFINISPE